MFRVCFGTLASVLLMAGTAHAKEPLVTVTGDLSAEMRDLLQAVLGEAEAPPRSVAQARRRVLRAAKKAEDVMRSQGYYGAEITPHVLEDGVDTDARRSGSPTPILTIKPGERFTLSDILVTYLDRVPDIYDVIVSETGLTRGEPAIAAHIVAAELRLVNYLNAHGFPDVKAHPRQAVVDHTDHTMDVTFNISTGQKTRFGTIRKTGTARITKGWTQMVAPFQSGDLFDIRELNRLTSRIMATGVFESTTAVLAEAATENPDGTVTRDVILDVEAGPLNTISAELGYSTTDGSGVTATYERRNFIGYAQTLAVTSTLQTNRSSLSVDYNIPYALRLDRELDVGGIISRENTEAFVGERAGVNVLMTQKLSDRIKVGLGTGFEVSQFEESGQDTRAYVVELMGGGAYDSRNNILDTDKGVLIESMIVPSYNFGTDAGVFTTLSLSANSYTRLSDNFVAAFRAKAGTIFSEDFETVPLNRRFYGGGGGSVRGFGYQTISPVNAASELTGGRSIVEGSTELRYQGEGPFGFAAFVDAASVSRSIEPEFDDIRVGAGIGLRYYTSFAPLRFDIAVPLNKRDGDDAFQVYISIGQAF